MRLASPLLRLTSSMWIIGQTVVSLTTTTTMMRAGRTHSKAKKRPLICVAARRRAPRANMPSLCPCRLMHIRLVPAGRTLVATHELARPSLSLIDLQWIDIVSHSMRMKMKMKTRRRMRMMTKRRNNCDTATPFTCPFSLDAQEKGRSRSPCPTIQLPRLHPSV